MLRAARHFSGVLLLAMVAAGVDALAESIVFTQIDGGHPRLVRLENGALEVLSEALYQARDPDVSFDGQRILFSGKRRPGDYWQVFEMNGDGSNLRQVTDEKMDCRSPFYQSTVYVITADEPWRQIGFVGTDGDRYPSLYSARPDGSMVRQITYNPYADVDPVVAADGRVLFSSQLRDRAPLFGVSVDGTGYATLTGRQGARWKRMPAVTDEGLAVFVESERRRPDGAGWLAAVSLRRPLHTYRRLTEDDGLFHSPSWAPGGSIVAARRPADGSGSFGIYRVDPAGGKPEEIFDDPDRDDIQPRFLAPRKVPDGRASVVNEEDPTGILYCLNVDINDLPRREWLPAGSARRLRVIEGMPYARPADDGEAPEPGRRLLGEVDVEEDGSFNVRVPANIPIELQLLDGDGMALRTCRWIWVRNKEPRGCIGCHEDGELTPENRLVAAVTKPSIALTLPEERRRRVSYERNVAPVIASKCANSACHGGEAQPPLTSSENVRAHVTGAARTSPLVWRIFGRSTSRPWDETANGAVHLSPHADAVPLTESEKRAIIEWIDLGAQ